MASTAGQFALYNKAWKRYNQLRLQVDEVISDDVIGVIPLNSKSDTGRIILKFFHADSVKLRSEIHAYETLQSLQGSTVPRCLGVFVIDGFGGYALGLCAVDGVTLRQRFATEGPSIELFRSVWSQLCTLHNLCVAHMDIRLENILIKNDQTVVFVDFSNSL
jgi:serine/threonine protein kinase